MKKLLALLALIMLCGCAGSPAAVSMMKPEELVSASSEQLCQAYAFSIKAKIRNEIQIRRFFTAKEWQRIDTESIYEGMSKLAMLATVQGVYFSGMTTTSGGIMEQWKTPGRTVNLYIYLIDDKVVSWSMI